MNGSENTASIQLTGFPALVVILLIGVIAYGPPAMKIAKRAGKPAWQGILMGIPVINIVWIWVFANSRWPSLETTKADE